MQTQNPGDDSRIPLEDIGAAIREGREPNSSVAGVLPCYEVLHQLEQQVELQILLCPRR